ncbi:MAG: hypothetical protein WC002_09955 [Candidatus Muiribacteriota bacterium]
MKYVKMLMLVVLFSVLVFSLTGCRSSKKTDPFAETVTSITGFIYDGGEEPVSLPAAPGLELNKIPKLDKESLSKITFEFAGISKEAVIDDELFGSKK